MIYCITNNTVTRFLYQFGFALFISPPPTEDSVMILWCKTNLVAEWRRLCMHNKDVCVFIYMCFPHSYLIIGMSKALCGFSPNVMLHNSTMSSVRKNHIMAFKVLPFAIFCLRYIHDMSIYCLHLCTCTHLWTSHKDACYCVQPSASVWWAVCSS